MTCTTYCVRIEEMFDAMICLAYEGLPENRGTVKEYVDSVWQMATVFVQSIKRGEGTEDLGSKFESYVTTEEKKTWAELRGDQVQDRRSRYGSSYCRRRQGGNGNHLKTFCLLEHHPNANPRSRHCSRCFISF